jgi:hypothetical protein
MTWGGVLDLNWTYKLVVGGQLVHASWTRAKGAAVGIKPPMILSRALGAPAADQPQESISPDVAGQNEDLGHLVVPESLPQGVSYDKETKSFQANIKNPTLKRYVFLGEFETCEAAHQKYLEALSIYSPAKQIAPALVA